MAFTPDDVTMMIARHVRSIHELQDLGQTSAKDRALFFFEMAIVVLYVKTYERIPDLPRKEFRKAMLNIFNESVDDIIDTVFQTCVKSSLEQGTKN